MLKRTLLIFFLLSSSVFAETTKTYTVELSRAQFLSAVEYTLANPDPIILPRIPSVIQPTDLEIGIYCKPLKYYQINKTLVVAKDKLNHFTHNTEIWSQGKNYVIKHTVDIGYGRQTKCALINNIKAKILRRVESTLINMEQKKILLLAKQLRDKPKIEYSYDLSWIIMQVVSTFEVAQDLLEKNNKE